VVSEVVAEALDALGMRYPKLDPKKVALAAGEASVVVLSRKSK